MYRFHIYRAKDGWRWRLKAKNGKIVADSGEAYASKRNATRAAIGLVRGVWSRHRPLEAEANARVMIFLGER